jgi:hypothetical protein
MASKKKEEHPYHDVFRVSHLPEEPKKIKTAKNSAEKAGRGQLLEVSGPGIGDREASVNLPTALGGAAPDRPSAPSLEYRETAEVPEIFTRLDAFKKKLIQMDSAVRELRKDALGYNSVVLAAELLIRKLMIFIQCCAEREVTEQAAKQLQGQLGTLLTNLSGKLVDSKGKPLREHYKKLLQLKQIHRELM